MRTRKEPMLCVDKTAYLHRLITDSQARCFFLGLKSLYAATLATTQAERRNYTAPYLAAGKPVWVIGLSFDSKTRELKDHCVEQFA